MEKEKYVFIKRCRGNVSENSHVEDKIKREDIVNMIVRVANNSGRAVYGTKCLRPLKHWGRGFEFHSRHGCSSVFVLPCVGSGLEKS
jgi:hypothetical protein